MIYDEFGVYFDQWKVNRKNVCQFKYANLKTELLNNTLYTICWNDFSCVYEQCKDFSRSDFIKYTMNACKYGQIISIDHL